MEVRAGKGVVRLVGDGARLHAAGKQALHLMAERNGERLARAVNEIGSVFAALPHEPLLCHLPLLAVGWPRSGKCTISQQRW